MTTISDVMEILEQISLEVMRLPARIKIAANQVTVTSGLGDISKRLGLVTAGEFRAGNDKEPGFGFSGVRIGYPPFSYGVEDWHIAGVNNDVLQVGINADDGKLYAGAGVIVMDSGGIQIEVSSSLSYVRSYKFVDTNGVTLGALAAYNTTANTTDISLATAGSRKAESVHINAYTADTGTTGVFASVSLLAQADNSPDPHLLLFSHGDGTAYIKVNANYADADTFIYGVTSSPVLTVDAGLEAVGIGGAAESGYKLKVTGKVNLTTGNTYDINGSPHTHSYLSDTATYSDISANDAATNVTGAELETLTDGSVTTLHKHSFIFALATYIDLNPITATLKYPYAGTVDRAITFVKWSQSIFLPGAAHDGTNYYTLDLIYRPTGAIGSDQTIASLNTQSLTTAGAYTYTLTTTSFSPTNVASGGYIYMKLTKTNAPSDIYVIAPELECILT